MAAAILNFSWEQGTTISETVTWKIGTPASAVDLNGYTARMQVRPAVSSTTVFVTFTTENGGIILGGASGTITITASATDSAGWTWPASAGSVPTGVYDLELASPAGVVKRLIKGTITLDPEVTRT